MAMQQRRGRKIAMDKAELDAFLTGERTCRVATASPQGPHLTALWLTSIVGEVPRTGTPDPRLDEPERLFARKYAGSDTMHHDGRHAWLRLVPDAIASWDFRKIKHSERNGSAPGGSGCSPA